jgi:hypothetical protein
MTTDVPRPSRRLTRIQRAYSSLCPPLKLLLPIWCLFFVLVAFGVHGSSISLAANWWNPGVPYSGYVFNFLTKSAATSADGYDSTLRDLAMAQPRDVRGDEWLNSTPSALSQFSHIPRFPVINSDIGDGQNMLVGYLNPVWHITTLARPATWGYFFLGRQRGLAWAWWFQVFSCFTVLFLLLDVVLKGNRKLAAFGAFWFCGSAYVACWSLWPAYHVFFPALACLSAYRLLSSSRTGVRICSGLLLGLSIPGFLMLLYPAWEVPLTYLFFAVLVALFFRDELYMSLKPLTAARIVPIALAALIAAALVAAFVMSCKPALHLMVNTVFPGRRASLGGDYSVASLFKGMYNSVTSYSAVPGEANRSEYASFFHLYPAIVAALFLSRRLARGIGPVAWGMVCYLAFVLFYQFVGFWPKIAKYTLFGMTTCYRADIAVGLASIILSVCALAWTSESGSESQGGWDRTGATLAGLTLATLVVIGGVHGAYLHGGFPPIGSIAMVAALAGLASYSLLRGGKSFFCYLIGTAVVASSGFFNPLSTNIDFLYRSDIATQIQRLDRQSSEAAPNDGRPPLWVCYGPDYPGTLVSLLGGRSIAGVQWPPQKEMWRKFDPTGQYEWFYNRFAHVQLKYENDPGEVKFEVPRVDTLIVGIAPDNEVLKSEGARYILAGYWAQKEIDSTKFPLTYQSADGNFSIFQIK